MAIEKNTNSDLQAERINALALILDDAFKWHALAERSGNTLIGERFILLDAHERVFSQIDVNGERQNKLELIGPTLVGTLHMDAENAALAQAEMEKQLPECGPYKVWDYQEFAADQSAKLMVTAKALDNMVSKVSATVDPHAFVQKQLSEQGFDVKFYGQIQGKLIDMRATSLEDDELERVFAGTVSKDFNCKFASAARDFGLKITDVYADTLVAHQQAAPMSFKQMGYTDSQAALLHANSAGTGYVVLAIDGLGNAAFQEPGRLLEVARIMKEAASNVNVQSAMTVEELRGLNFKVHDLNGNPVGKVSYSQTALTGDAPPGTVRMAISAEGLDGLAGSSLGRILQTAASQVAKGNDEFVLHGAAGQEVGKFEFKPLPSPAQDGVIDMADALSSRKVFWAESGYSGLADGEYMFVVATPDYEPNYGQEAGPVWLVNAKGEIAPGYDDPKVVRESNFNNLSKEQETSLRAVIDGSLSIDDFNGRFNPDDQDDTPGMP